MAGNEIGGFLNITPDVLNKLNSFDEKLEKIQQHSKTAAEALKNGFSSVVVDTSKLESAITSLTNKIGALGTAGNAVQNIGTSMNTVSQGAQQASVSISSMAEMLQRIKTPNFSEQIMSPEYIASIKESIRQMKAALRFDENGVSPLDATIKAAIEKQKALYESQLSDYRSFVNTRNKIERDAATESVRQETTRLNRMSKAMDDWVDKAKTAQTKYEDAVKRMNDFKSMLPDQKANILENAMDFSKSAKSIGEITSAIKLLKQAREMLEPEKDKKAIQDINNAIVQHNRALQQAGVQSQALARNQRNLMDTAGQLQRKIALLFSVSQIEGYIGKIVKVRGEFELQQVALRAIIQDKDKADKIFSQTLNQALKSPFQAGQLITFTKQLAAYRIESDKLFDTTKRLADVSAGLGVSMDRLILAYGQVKAAAYLRGSEVRQFTEAGINMYGELQSYFEEVKGEAYTTAQIVDMISKRMVKFEDVEAVFQRMTDKGGLFFNMQEVQVNTLSGQINRLKDVISVMFNEIGKSNQEGFLSISTGISLINDLLENWRLFASVIKTVVFSYGALKAASVAMLAAERVYMANSIAQRGRLITLDKVINGLKWKNVMATRAQAAATAGAATAQRGLNAAMAANPYGAILAIVVAVGTAIYEAVGNANRLKDALDGIAAEGEFSSVQSANEYAKLASTVTDSTKSYQEHNKALSELKKKYSDILPEQYLNAEGIKNLNGNYQEAIKTIHQYINAKTKERMIDEIGQDANKEMYSNQQKTAKEIAKIVEEQHGMKVSWSEISGILSQVQDKLMNGTIKSVQQLREETENVVEAYTGLGKIDLSDYFTRLSGSSFGGADRFRFDKIQIERSVFSTWFESAKSYLTQIEEIENRFNRDSLTRTAQSYQAQKDATDKMISNEMSAYDVLRESQKKNSKVMKEELENAKNLVQKVLKAIGSNVEVNSAYINKLFNDSFFFEDEKRKATQTKLRQLFEKLSKEAEESGDTSGKLWLEQFEKQINGLDLTPFQNSLRKFMEGFVGNEDIQANWVIRNGESEEEFKKRIKTEIDTRNEIIRKSQSSLYPEYGQDVSKVKEELKELNSIYSGLGDDNNKGRSSAERDIWAERISVLKEMQSRYEKLNQLMGENRAIAETRTAFKGALDFTQMGEVIKAEDIIPTKQGMIDALEKLLEQIPNDVKNASKRTGLEKEIAELKIGIQQDYLKEQLDKTKQNIEDMFNGLDLHQKLKDAGLSESEVQALFPGLAKTLDEVEKGIHEKFNALRDDNGQLGKTEQKDYEDALNKLNQQRVKESQDLVIELTKAYKTQLSDQLQLDRWYYEEKAKIAKANLTDEQKEKYNKNLTSQYNQKTDENTWKQFQKSDMYVSLFENIEVSSTRMLKALRDKLGSLRNELKNLPADQLKAIINQQEKIDEMIAKKNPFKNLASDAKKYVDFLRQRKELEQENIRATNAVSIYTKQRDAQSQIVEQKRQEYNEAVSLYGIASKEANLASVQLATEQSKLDLILKQLVAEERITEKTAEQIRNGQKLGKTLSDKFNEASSNLSEFSSAFSQIASDLENVFGVMSAGTKDTIDSISEIASGLGQTAGGVGRIIASNGADIDGWIQAVGGIAKTIVSIFAIGDKKKEREIQRQIKNVELLGKKYDELKENMEAAWNSVTLHDTTKETIKNLDDQIASYRSMIKAEQDKKKTDNDRIKEWNDAIIELEKTKKEIMSQEQMDFGAIGGEKEYRSAAESFVQAWMDAFNETEDGLKSLNENFDDFIENLIVKQATMRLAQNRLKNLFEEIDKSVTESSVGGINLTKEELANIQSIGKTALKGLNEDLLALMETLGYKPNKKAELSALTQGITQVSEETASEISALLNSIRFFVSQQTTDISAIKELLDARYSLESEYSDSNPMLIELRAQTGYLEILSDRIDRVFAPSPNSKGAGLRVFIG